MTEEINLITTISLLFLKQKCCFDRFLFSLPRPYRPIP